MTRFRLFFSYLMVALPIFATPELPETAEDFFAMGTMHYRAGHYAEAAVSYEYAASLTENRNLLSRSLYNTGNCLVKSGEQMKQEDPQTANSFCRQAAHYYRQALAHDLTFKDAAYNLEVTLLLVASIEEEIQQQQEKENQENELIRYIREKLQEFIDRQTRLIETQTLGEPQQTLESETRALAEHMAASGLHEDVQIGNEQLPGPLKATYQHTVAAADAMNILNQQTALAELIAALGAAPEDPNESDEGDEEDSEYDDEFDMEYDESDQDAESYQEADPFGDFSEYEEIRGVPPPNKTEMDILAEEVRNQERRKQKKPGEYKSVEKDW